MCGIVGWVDWSRNLREQRPLIAAMTRTLARRGPDDEGLWLSRNAAFGHRRLAVVDLLGGAQPMVSGDDESTASVITYAGEIYNASELRVELEHLGHRFRTRSDTEVVLRAYEQWQEASVDRLLGMFAFGIWNGRRQELLLARDRSGVKPLYYAETPEGVLFASEPKALLAHPAVPADVDTEGLAEIFVMDMIRTPGNAVFSGMRELRPGHMFVVTRDRRSVRQYWRLEARQHDDDEGASMARILDLLTDTVTRQLVADVPVCCMLSGGLDSSMIVALAGREVAASVARPLATFSVTVADDGSPFNPTDLHPDRDEPWVQRVAEWAGSEHREVVVSTEDLLEHQLEPMAARDLPTMGDRDTSLMLLCRAIKASHTVALSGESADELFGGYPWFYHEKALSRDVFPWHASRAPGLVQFLAADVVARIRPVEYEASRLADALLEVPISDQDDHASRRIREVLYLHQTRFLPALLDRKDRISMAEGVEVRVPFCDHRLVDYAWNIPWAIKSFGNREKGVLRGAFANVLPHDVLWRQKCGFPVSQSPRYEAALRERTRALLRDGNAPIRPLLDLDRVRAAVGDTSPVAPARNGRTQGRLFADLLQVNAWMDRYGVSIR